MLSDRFPAVWESREERGRPGGPERTARPTRAFIPILFSLLTCFSAAPARPAPLPGPDTGSVRVTSRGSVQGFVLDARTRHPLPGAVVRVEEEGAFARDGSTVAQTNAAGRYTARAPIGRSSSKIDWIRVFTSFPLLLALQPQSATKQSRTVLATRLNLRVEREGYLPFVGEVHCARLDAGKFAVHMDDVWLAPAGSGLTSSSPDHVRYERIESFTVEPAVARPGDRVTIRARVYLPFERGGRYRVYFDASAPGLVTTAQPLKAVGQPDPATGISTFQQVVRLPSQPRTWSTELSPWISLDYHEIPVGWDLKALLQVVRNDSDVPAARQVAEGYDHLVRGSPGAAVESLQQATAGAPKYPLAYRYLGEAYHDAGRTDEAATAYEQLVALAPEDLEVALPRYAEALLDSGRTDAAARALEAAEKHSKRIPASVSLVRARLFARRGDLHAADEQLARAGRSARIPRPLQREIALRRAQAALRAAPDSPDAELALARALTDLDRGEEAARHARRAQSLRPNEPWPLIELAGLENRLGHTEVAAAALERSLALDPKNGDAHLALAQMELADGQYLKARDEFRLAAELRPYDFPARHGLALAELRAGDGRRQTEDGRRKTEDQSNGGSEDRSPVPGGSLVSAASATAVCRLPSPVSHAALEALRAAAVIGRGKGELDTGFEAPFGPLTTLYFGPKRLKIEGFNRREAADDYELAQALERLNAHPEDAFASFNAGTALARLGQPDLALETLDRAAALKPELADLPYWRAVALAALHRPDEARRALEETLRQNPQHRHAHIALARLCLDAGEVEQAEAHLAAHRQNWPNDSERDPNGGSMEP